MKKQSDKPMMPSLADRESWPNPATRPMPKPAINPHCEDIRRAYASSQHGAQSTHKLIVKHRE